MTDDELNDRIAEWHAAPPGSPLAKMELHEHLGMTRDEYATWVSGAEECRPLLDGDGRVIASVRGPSR